MAKKGKSLKNMKNNSAAKKKYEGKSLKKKFKKQDKRGRILIKNLPFKVTEDDLKKYFSKYGNVSEVQLPRREDGTMVGCGFLQFSARDKADKAVSDTNGKEFMGRTLQVSFALPKLSYIAARPDEVPLPSITGRQVSASKASSPPVASGEQQVDEALLKVEREDVDVKQEPPHDVGSGEKIKKEKPLQTRGRLIVRNLPFKVTDETLKQHFTQFGEVHDVKLLRRPDGKLVGCGFVQFTKKQNAAKAIFKTSGKPFMGRTIIVDWAVPKNVFEAKMQEEDTTEVKQEPEDDVVTIKEAAADEELDNDIHSETKPTVKKHRDSSSDESDQSDVDGEDEKQLEDKCAASDVGSEESRQETKQRTFSNDITEGCTVFVKNIPFSVTNEQLRACVEQFGEVVYALVCVDPLTEHSKGTGFVKFKNKESAEKCLSSGEELLLEDQQLEMLPALPRQEIQDRAVNRKQATRNKDTRNLYLVKEGVVMAGSHAAMGVSAADMARRLQLEQWKSQILRNLNMFVSRTRLVVHNLPPSWDDARLRQLFTTHAPPGTFIKEARVMRNMRDVDVHGVGRSKEYGFVTFGSHEAALHTLRSINNNPKIFTPAKRPIVSFSIENKAILNLKQRRLMKSREKNPMAGVREGKGNARDTHKEPIGRNRLEREGEEVLGEEREEFVGLAARPGKVKMRSRFNLKTQAAVHGETIRQEKRRRKDLRRASEVKKSRRTSAAEREPRVQKKNKKIKNEHKAEEVFNKLVNKYKNKLSSMSSVKKWYE